MIQNTFVPTKQVYTYQQVPQQQQVVRQSLQLVQPAQFQQVQSVPQVIQYQQSQPIKVVHQISVQKNLPGPCFICQQYPFIGDPQGSLQKCHQQIEAMRNLGNNNLGKNKQTVGLQEHVFEDENQNEKSLRKSNLNMNNDSNQLLHQSHEHNNSIPNFNFNQQSQHQQSTNNHTQHNIYDANYASQEVEDIVNKYMNYS